MEFYSTIRTYHHKEYKSMQTEALSAESLGMESLETESCARVKNAIDAIKNGEMIIIMDDEDRENEGDLVMAGIFSTPEKINFMAQEARGLICVSLTNKRAKELDLPPMVQKNDSNHETAFTISIDAKAAKTGISAYERDMTIRLMCEKSTKPSDFVRPGHIFPLIAKDGGVLVRTGHTEASVDICRLAGLAPISVICEIMKKDGSMAGRGDRFLLDFAREHKLKILYVSDIIEYRLKFENLVHERARESGSFMGVMCEKIGFLDHLEREHIVFSFASQIDSSLDSSGAESRRADSKKPSSAQKPTQNTESKPPLVRFHNASSDIALLQNAQEWQVLQKSIELLSQNGGFLVCLNAKACALESKSAESSTDSSGDIKDFGIGAQILKQLGVRDFALLSSSKNNKHSSGSEYNALSGFDLHLVEKIEL